MAVKKVSAADCFPGCIETAKEIEYKIVEIVKDLMP